MNADRLFVERLMAGGIPRRDSITFNDLKDFVELMRNGIDEKPVDVYFRKDDVLNSIKTLNAARISWLKRNLNLKNKNDMRRYKKTLRFLKKSIGTPKTPIIDLGTNNPLAELMRKEGYLVRNTGIEDLDKDVWIDSNGTFTAFEIFEHLLAPFNFLIDHSGVLIASVPLSVPISSAVWVKGSDWDCHYHEFEKRQFDMLLKRTGWEIVESEVWYGPDKIRLGIRPFLRFLFPCYYIIHAVKVS